MPNNDGEFRGATTAQIEFLKDQLRDIRVDLKEISVVLSDLKDFKTKVLAYAALAAAAATFGIQFLMDRMSD
jgi:hypothetical protein